MHSSSHVSRRRLLRRGAAASLGVFAAAQISPKVLGFAEPAAGEEVVPFIDGLKRQERQQVYWGDEQPWLTPTEGFFSVGHYPRPEPLDLAAYRLELSGQFDKPVTLTLEQIKARPRKELTATIECSGNG